MFFVPSLIEKEGNFQAGILHFVLIFYATPSSIV